MNENMRLSKNGRNLIKEFEGLRLNAYQDSVGKWTIGYGHTQGVYSGMSISQAQADAFLDQDVTSHAAGIFNFVTVKLNQNQFDALVSFHFNLGAYILQDSTLLTYINNKNWQAAANEMKAYVHAGNQVLPGLVRRRNAEVALFLSTTTNEDEGQTGPETKTKGEIEMQLTYQIDNGPGVYYFDGVGVKGLHQEGELEILRRVYKANNDKDLPHMQFNSSGPFYAHLIELSRRAYEQ